MRFEDAAQQIVDVGRRMDARGWAPAGAGNYSVRLDDGSFAVTVSGTHKGRIGLSDVMRVDGDGLSLDGRTPSAETLLHVQLYRLRPQVGAVLHTHSVAATVLSRRLGGTVLRLQDYEVMKAFPGVDSHATAIDLPVLDNDQDMVALCRNVDAVLGAAPAYLIRGHGLYGWGRDPEEAARVIEAAEFLLDCELEHMKLGDR